MSLRVFALALLFFAFCGIFSAARSAYLSRISKERSKKQANQSKKKSVFTYTYRSAI